MPNAEEEIKTTLLQRFGVVKSVAKAWITAKSAQRPWVVVGSAFGAGLVLGLSVKQYFL